MRADRERLLDIIEAVERIEKYSTKGRQAFEHDELVQTWMAYHIQIIGEAAANVTKELQKQHPEIPWPQIVAMRNILVHEYFEIDADEVWSVIENDLPNLKKNIIAILQKL